MRRDPFTKKSPRLLLKETEALQLWKHTSGVNHPETQQGLWTWSSSANLEPSTDGKSARLSALHSFIFGICFCDKISLVQNRGAGKAYHPVLLNCKTDIE